MRPKSEIYTPKQDDEYPHPYTKSPPPRDAEEQNDLKRCNAKKKSKTDKDLYDIEIVQVDKERKRFKIHFVRLGLEINSTSGVISVPAVDGFPFVRLQKSFVPGEESLEDRRYIFHGHLYRAVKRKVRSSQREDPMVRIELPIEADVFSCDLGRTTKINFQIPETEKKLLNSLTNVKRKMRGKKNNQKVKWLT